MYCVASESCAFDLIGARYVREVEPGEVVTLDAEGVHSQIVASGERRAFCVFEYIYFARPDSLMNGRRLQVSRAKMGEILWREAPVDADLVIADPGFRQRRRSRPGPRRRHARRTTASSRTVTSRARSSSPVSSCARTACG